MSERGAARVVTCSFAASIAGSTVFAASFALGGQPQLEGAGLAIACFGLMTALLVWVKKLIPAEEVVDHQHPERSALPERSAAERELRSGAFSVVGRRHWLVRWGVAAGAALVAAMLFPHVCWDRVPKGASV